jgi:hypothetical protein
MAFLLGFSERAFDTILSKLEDGIFKQAAPATAGSATDLKITTDPKLPDGKIGQDYTDAKGASVILQASGGTSDYKWSVAPGSLPAYLELTAKGVLQGKTSQGRRSNQSHCHGNRQSSEDSYKGFQYYD